MIWRPFRRGFNAFGILLEKQNSINIRVYSNGGIAGVRNGIKIPLGVLLLIS